MTGGRSVDDLKHRPDESATNGGAVENVAGRDALQCQGQEFGERLVGWLDIARFGLSGNCHGVAGEGR